MSADPITSLARQRIIKLSAELEVQLGGIVNGAPVVEILNRLRDRAAESLAALAFVNINSPKGLEQMLTLQNEVKRYDEWVAWIAEIIGEGKQYDQQMTQEAREEMLDYLAQHPEGEQEAVALGLIDPKPRGT